MKNLFIFHMISATMLFSAQAEEKVSYCTTEKEVFEDEENENFLDAIANDVKSEQVKRIVPAYTDYAKIALRISYCWFIEKPLFFCKYYIYRLQSLLEKKN